MIEPKELIESLSATDQYMEIIFMTGACYHFHLFLKTVFPAAEPFMNRDKNHVITQIDGRYYDIKGEVPVHHVDGCFPLEGEELEMAKKWSFSKFKNIVAEECHVCGEPFTI